MLTYLKKQFFDNLFYTFNHFNFVRPIKLNGMKKN